MVGISSELCFWPKKVVLLQNREYFFDTGTTVYVDLITKNNCFSTDVMFGARGQTEYQQKKMKWRSLLWFPPFSGKNCLQGTLFVYNFPVLWWIQRKVIRWDCRSQKHDPSGLLKWSPFSVKRPYSLKDKSWLCILRCHYLFFQIKNYKHYCAPLDFWICKAFWRLRFRLLSQTQGVNLLDPPPGASTSSQNLFYQTI